MRVEHLKRHLKILQEINEHNEYAEDIRNTVNEINKELGIGKDAEKQLATYSTKELHEELVKREGVEEVIAPLDVEATVKTTVGDCDEVYSFTGPVRILINKD